jgi:hypothetical protein
MFVQSEKFVEAHGGKIGDISIYGQESNSTTGRQQNKRSDSTYKATDEMSHNLYAGSLAAKF